ncbi:diaminopimelate epimerase [Bdellovibrionota bacterium]
MSWHRLPFSKMSGTGNDFIIIDNRQKIVPSEEQVELTKLACHRTLSLGADGVIFIEPSSKADFSWAFYNADGSKAEMCGNGARCVTRYAQTNGIGSGKISFETGAGLVTGAVINESFVQISMQDPHSIELDYQLQVDDEKLYVSSINTGVPHVVIEEKHVEGKDLKSLGRKIRNHPRFQPQGTNVNFISIQDRGNIITKTYERGVEDFTLACGTGAMAIATICHARGLVDNPVKIHVAGGTLGVNFKQTEQGYKNLTLAGDARLICEGELTREALNFKEKKNV